MPMYNLIESSKNYSKTAGCLWNYYRDQPNSGAVGDINYSNLLIKIECKMLTISELATNSALTAVEIKTPVISLVKKSDYEIQISEAEKKVSEHNQDKYITIPEFNNLAAEVFTARLAQVTKTDFDNRLVP